MRTKINDSPHTGIECELDEQLPRACAVQGRWLRCKVYQQATGTMILLVYASSHVQYTQTDTVRNYKFTIRTVCQIVKDSFLSVYNRKIVPR